METTLLLLTTTIGVLGLAGVAEASRRHLACLRLDRELRRRAVTLLHANPD